VTEQFARRRTLLRELLAADASRAGRQCSHCPLSHWRWADHNLRLARGELVYVRGVAVKHSPDQNI
jgi:hypothetical protein